MDLAPIDEAVLLARQELWRRGDLRWKLHATQQKIYDLLKGKRRYFLKCSRRLGKSYALLAIAAEFAIKTPGARISYAAPTAKDASQIVNDIAAHLFGDCPPEIKPEWFDAAKEFRFPHNGAIIRVAGVNAEHLENLRGRAAHIFILDECGSMSDLRYLIDSIVGPTLITTKGRMLLASTPPKSPGHDMTKVVADMEKRGEVSTFTLLDAPDSHIDYEEKVEILERAGENPEHIPGILAGKLRPETTSVLREYFCEFVTDAEMAVLPEFTAQARSEIVRVTPRQPYFFCYTAIDPGFTDKTGMLFAWYDYPNKILVIEDELLLSRATTDDIAYAIKDREQVLWGAKQPQMRITDLDLRLIADLVQRHGLAFSPANRQDASGGIDIVRNMIRRRELAINPTCTNLIRQMTNATFNKKGTDFERSQEDAHYDLVAALRILCRAVPRTLDPFPGWYGRSGFGTSSAPQAPKNRTVFTDTPLGRRLAKKWG